jgi:hypothetical protein
MQDFTQIIEERIREAVQLAKETDRKFEALLELLAEKGIIASADLERVRQSFG